MAIRVRTGQWEKVRFAKSTLRLLAQKPDAIWGSDAGFELFGQIMPPRISSRLETHAADPGACSSKFQQSTELAFVDPSLQRRHERDV